MTERQKLSAQIHDIQARLKLNRKKSCQLARSGQRDCVTEKSALGIERETLQRELQTTSSTILSSLMLTESDKLRFGILPGWGTHAVRVTSSSVGPLTTPTTQS
jgi:hypothetical protein